MTRTGWVRWVGLLALASLVGCGGSRSKRASAVAAPTASGTTTAATTGGVAAPGSGSVVAGISGSGIGAAVTSGTIARTSSTTGGSSAGSPPDDHGDDAAHASALRLATATAGTIEVAGDADWFQADLSAGVDYVFRTGALGAGMDTVLRLIDTDGTTLLEENDDAAAGDPASRITFSPTATATYYLIVVHKSPAASGGTYDITYALGVAGGGGGGLTGTPAGPGDDHGDGPAYASALSVNGSRGGEIEVWTDEDWFQVTLVAGRSYDLYTVTPWLVAETGDTVLTVLDAQGNLVTHNDDEDYNAGLLNSRIDNFVPAVSGVYYLGVTGFQPLQRTTTYRIHVRD